ncbi:paxillin isoform X1 [Ischnura elegans]|uniref:paxillin isoform X1 n=1 Tax=Ischnura elegans TaxID=197161 RepID=UPI001ED884C6|nr:paxillin isoform X1 [Ischnura elegans]
MDTPTASGGERKEHGHGPRVRWGTPLQHTATLDYEDSYDSFDSEKMVSVDGLLSIDALLADLQNTISHGGPASPGGGYGSLNGPSSRSGGGDHTIERIVRHEHRGDLGSSPPPPISPTYQNQRMIQETMTTTTTKSQYPTSHHVSSGHRDPPPSLNNNLSELDNLLQDLSNARYTGYSERKEMTHLTNGSPSPSMVRSPSSASRDLPRPSVDSLLDELDTVVPNGDAIDGRTTTIHTTIRETRDIGYHPPTSGPAASSATKELDDLMASLSDFKINASTHQHQTVTDSPYAKPNKATKSTPPPAPHPHHAHHQHHHPPQSPPGTNHHPRHQPSAKQNQLDSMLGNLQADMSRQGVNTTQKGCCSACDKPIVGQVITALGKTWHPEHFTCNHCNSELGTRNFFERDGVPYCEPDYHNLFSPRCAYCNGPILDKCVTALEKTWHTEHFFCAQCGKQFGEEGFHEKEGKPYCKDDYFDMFAPKCGGCNRPIMENYISALNGQWHPDCFVCRDCRQPFHGGSFFDHEGLPYCETHYHAKRGSLCAGCHKPITGRCITAMFRKFHPEHFVCAFCLKQLNKGTFKEQNDKPYCHACFDKLFG